MELPPELVGEVTEDDNLVLSPRRSWCAPRATCEISQVERDWIVGYRCDRVPPGVSDAVDGTTRSSVASGDLERDG